MKQIRYYPQNNNIHYSKEGSLENEPTSEIGYWKCKSYYEI
jgi:hypothetical protein